MELRHLRYFICVADMLHFGRAAAALGISQPPLSQQVRALEDELGIRLFDRTSRSVALTDAGRLFLVEARAVLAQADHAVQVARRAARGEVGALSIGFNASAPFVPIVARAISAFRRSYADVRLELSELSHPAQMIAAIGNASIDIGFMRSFGVIAVPPGVVARRLVRERLFVAMPPDHPLVARETLSLADLGGAPLIVYGRDLPGGFTQELIALFDSSGVVPAIVQDVSEIPTLLGLVAAGIGLTVLSESLCSFQPARLAYRPLDHGEASTTMWLFHADGVPSLTCANFLAVLEGAA